MNHPSIRARLIEARTHVTHARVLLQAAETDAAGASWEAIAAAVTSAQETERKIRHALDSTAAETEGEG